jgi:putative membrane protein
MTTWELLTSTWDWQPAVLLACAVLLVGYLAALRFRPVAGTFAFAAGVCLLLVALASPLAMLGHLYLFSAHMVQHLLLVLLVPPLLWLGIPPQLARRMVRRPAVRAVQRACGQPLVAWLAGAGAMWIWHLPALYNAALRQHSLHLVEHASLLTMGVVFWLPVVSPLEEDRLSPLLAVVYLFTACVGCTILGITLTFAPPGLYPAYLHPADPLGIVPLLRQGWGLTPATDQQLGGLLMWVPACLVYLSAVIGVLARWYATPETETAAAPIDAVPELPLARG